MRMNKYFIGAGLLIAGSFLFGFDAEDELVKKFEFTPWVVEKSSLNCGAWSPSTNSIEVGMAFTQSRQCETKQSRVRIDFVFNEETESFEFYEEKTEYRMQPYSRKRSSLGTG